MEPVDLVLLIPFSLFLVVMVERLVHSRKPSVEFFTAHELYLIGRFAKIWSILAVVLFLAEILNGLQTGTTLIEETPVTWDWFLWQGLMIVFAIGIAYVFPPIISFFEGDTLEDMMNKSSIDTIYLDESSEKVLDAIDWEILSTIKTRGGSFSIIAKESSKWIPMEETVRRIQKLVLLRYIGTHKNEVFLTPEGMDAANLPPVLFAQTIIDKYILKKLAEIRIGLRRENAHKVIVESSKLLEHILKDDIILSESFSEDDYKHYNPKGFVRATLGDLIGYSRNRKLIDKFEDKILSAFTEVRKLIHSRSPSEKKREMTIEKAYFAFTLLEIFTKYHYSARKQPPT